jgi:formyl-CoA transferase
VVERSPLLGEHTDEILRQVLGFTDHQVAEIHDSGALDPPRKVVVQVAAPAYARFEH